MPPAYPRRNIGMKKISIIVAIARNCAIGINNQLLWHISGDLKRFKNRRPKYFSDEYKESEVPLLDNPDQFMMVVAGGKGKHSVFIPTFGKVTAQTRPINDKTGRAVTSINDYRSL